MMQGKITPDKGSYVVKVGGVSIDITEDVCALIEQERARTAALLTQEREHLAGIVERYNQISAIILASDTVLPIG